MCIQPCYTIAALVITALVPVLLSSRALDCLGSFGRELEDMAREGQFFLTYSSIFHWFA